MRVSWVHSCTPPLCRSWISEAPLQPVIIVGGAVCTKVIYANRWLARRALLNLRRSCRAVRSIHACFSDHPGAWHVTSRRTHPLVSSLGGASRHPSWLEPVRGTEGGRARDPDAGGCPRTPRQIRQAWPFALPPATTFREGSTRMRLSSRRCCRIVDPWSTHPHQRPCTSPCQAR